MIKNKATIIIALTALTLTACQEQLPPEKPINQGDRPRVTRTVTPVEEVLPVLKENKQGVSSEFKLRSQTSRYTESAKTQMEIALTSSRLAYCQNENPELQEGEELLQITVKSRDGKTPVDNGELAKNEAYEIAAVYQGGSGKINLAAADFESLKISDLNNAIVRGSLKIANADLQIEGEFFTAICK